jgi:endonuclease IV
MISAIRLLRTLPLPLLGSHLSIGGDMHKAADKAPVLGMDTVQIFTHSPSQWAVTPVNQLGKADSRPGWLFTRN